MENILLIWAEEGEGAVLLGVYGSAPVLTLPETIEGRPLVKIGRYCFAPNGREPEGARRTFLGDPELTDVGHRICGNFIQEVSLIRQGEASW